ncbi:MAG: PLP-dependent aminotransferase family protein [Gemmatimonadetes bacterium]|nr:PLP-dependent aminotransferase family protein [Gemmatimonadota bacterium]
MTIWIPDLSRADGPIYLALAEAIAREIDTGGLAPGSRLPTHRELADGLDVALTTVTRGYAEAERRGLVSGEVGRGTFVRRGRSSTRRERSTADSSIIDFTVNALLPYAHAPELAASMGRVISDSDPWMMLDYQPQRGSERQRTAGALWMERAGVAASPDRVLVTSGAQHAMAVTFATLANPGDTVLTEELTYSGMKSLGHHLHLRLKGVAMDQDGLRPDAFARRFSRHRRWAKSSPSGSSTGPPTGSWSGSAKRLPRGKRLPNRRWGGSASRRTPWRSTCGWSCPSRGAPTTSCRRRRCAACWSRRRKSSWRAARPHPTPCASRSARSRIATRSHAGSRRWRKSWTRRRNPARP